MRLDWPAATDAETVFRVDGGMASNDWMLQFLADILGVTVERPAMLETTAVGAAYLAGFASGLCPPPDQVVQHSANRQRFEPRMGDQLRDAKYQGWRDAVRRTRGEG